MILYLIPFIGAIIGWLSNKLVLSLIFRKVFATRKEQIATQLGNVVATQLFNTQGLSEKIKDPANLKDVAPFIDKHIDEFLHVKLKEKLPVISMFVSDAMLGKIKEGLTEEIEVLLPQVLGQFADKMLNNLQLEKIVAEKLKAISAEQLETLAYQNLGKQLRAFTLIGAVTGFIIGLIALLCFLIA